MTSGQPKIDPATGVAYSVLSFKGGGGRDRVTVTLSNRYTCNNPGIRVQRVGISEEDALEKALSEPFLMALQPA